MPALSHLSVGDPPEMPTELFGRGANGGLGVVGFLIARSAFTELGLQLPFLNG